MLGSIRKFSSSIFAKVFLFIVAIPFVFWGMGDVFRSGNQNTIVKIGNEKISVFFKRAGCPDEVINEWFSNISSEIEISTARLCLKYEDRNPKSLQFPQAISNKESKLFWNWCLLLDKNSISSSIIRLAHEIYERNKELDNLVLKTALGWFSVNDEV